MHLLSSIKKIDNLRLNYKPCILFHLIASLNLILILLAVVACSKIHSIHKKHKYDIGKKEHSQY